MSYPKYFPSGIATLLLIAASEDWWIKKGKRFYPNVPIDYLVYNRVQFNSLMEGGTVVCPFLPILDDLK